VAATKAKPSASAPTQAKPKDYEIKLLVPAKVGDRRELQLTAYRVSKTETKNKGITKVSKADRDEFLFTGTFKTLAVDDRGLETKNEITVDRCIVKDEQGQPLTVLDTGTIITAEADKDTTHFVRKGSQLEPLAEQVLQRFFALKTSATGPLDADLFATNRRQQIGATWAIHKGVASKMFKGIAVDFSADQLTGGGKLLRPVTLNDVECLEMQFVLTVKQAAASAPPKGLKGVASMFQKNSTETYPVDYRSGPVRRLTRVEMHEQYRGIPGTQQEDLAVEFTSTDTTEEKLKYLTKD
jgi:hypothetical protein